MRFTLLEDGWYRDKDTGLEWSRTAPNSMYYENTIVWCNAVGGRLPTIEELIGIVDYSKYAPCTDLSDTQSSYYWSASTYARSPNYAWIISFNFGFVTNDYKTNENYVRAVRSSTAKKENK